MAKQTHKEEVRFKTGSTLLDLVVGGGLGEGYPGGRIINLVGDKSSGKTFLACEIVAAARAQYEDRLKWVYDDSESGFTFQTKSMYGFEIMPENEKERFRSETVEDLYCNVRKFLTDLDDDELGIYIVDSLDGLTSEEQDDRADARYQASQTEKEFKKGSYQMGKPKYLSQEFFPQLAKVIEDKNALLIIISQLRDNIDPFSFEKDSRAGGRALDFYAHTVLKLNGVTKIKRKDRIVGTVVKAKTTKSKSPRPFRECMFTLLFDYGLDNIGSSLDFLYDLRGDSGMLLKDANSIAWGEGAGGERIDPTTSNLRAFLEEIGRWEEYKTDLKVSNGGKMPNDPAKKGLMLEWIMENEEVKYGEKFGTNMTRDELIDYIESKGLQQQLAEKVREKWETVEKAIKTNRKPKYL